MPERPVAPASARPVTRRVLALVVVALSVLLAAPAPPAHAQSAPPGTSTLQIDGRGFGHGRGMGQYGALGYAVDRGWDSGRILAHYYGGTAPGRIAARLIRVRLLAREGQPMAVMSDGGMVTDVAGPAPRRAVLVWRLGPNQFGIFDGDSCDGPWGLPRAVVTASQVQVAPATPPGDDPSKMLQLCEAGGVRRAYRGALHAVEASGTQHAVNEVDLEQYLRGNVPRETPASWADLGGGAGLQALRAQAIAARSYAASESRYGWAQTCDTTACQVYRGFGEQVPGQAFRVLEDRRSDAAIAGTAGEVRVHGDGRVARTEYSSSTGGWTAGGTFPAVVDEGDATRSNPNATWSRRVPASEVSARYQAGPLLGIDVLARNGLGPDGGRVTQLRLRFADGTRTVTGADFRSRLGLRSDWFRVTDLGPGDAKPPPAGPVAGAPAGYVLDAFGGLAPFNGAPAAQVSMYRPGQDVARRVVVRPDGAGYVMDAWGELHPFATASTPAPPKPEGGGRRFAAPVARDVVLLPGLPGAGYVLDASGGLHAFGGAFPATPSGTWPGGDLARALVIRPDGRGGYVLDAYGGLHPFRVLFEPLPPRPTGLAYWRGWDVARSVVLTGPEAGWTVDATGAAHPFGGAAGRATWSWPGRDVVAGAEAAGGTAVIADRFGGLHTVPESAPALAPGATWPGWPVARDVGLVPPR